MGCFFRDPCGAIELHSSRQVLLYGVPEQRQVCLERVDELRPPRGSRGNALEYQSSRPRGAKFEGSEAKSKPDVAEEPRIVRTSAPIPVSLGALPNPHMLVNDNAVADWKRGRC